MTNDQSEHPLATDGLVRHALSAILAGFSVAVYLLMQHHLFALTDAALRGEFTEFGDEVGRAGSLSAPPDLLPRAPLCGRGPRIRPHHSGG